MDLKARLQTLATLEAQYPHVLSIYLRCREGGRDRRKENLIFIKNRAHELERVLGDDKKGIDFLRKGVAAAELIRNQDLSPSVIGLALFLKGDEVIERFETSIPFEDQVAYRRYPFISQLAYIGEEFEPYAVVYLDSRSARIFEIAVGELVDTSDIRNEVHRRIHRGGWSQMRYQRAIEGEKHGHVQEVADTLAELVSKHRYKRIVIVGPDKPRAILKNALTGDVARRVIDGERVDSRATDHELLQTAVDYFRKAEDEEETAKMDRVVREIHSSTMGVSGLEDTLTYLARGQAYEVLLPADLARQGSHCQNCGMIFKDPTKTCHACESKDVIDVDLKEVVTRTAVKYGTRLEFVKNNGFKAKLGGAAALLRSPRMS
ncbi:MAG: host attachment protein [Planctomycetes bacterium]|nr:host attachment protein [Planctomycetota bacterium]MCW8135708.1 host attachment protein [Planctomycetota bacterium]